MTFRDFIPRNWSAFADWMVNFYMQLIVLASKYSISTATLDQTKADKDWIVYWVQAKITAKAQEKQLTDFIEGVARGKLGKPDLSDPTWTLPASPPAGVSTGITDRVREIANFIKSQKSIYSRADGELLGIVTAEEAGLVEADFTPELKLHSMYNYNLEADFRKFGLEALRVEFRYKGGTWQLAAILTKSPGMFNIVPQVAGNAEQVEIRAIGIRDNQPFGNYTPIFTEIIQP